MITQTYFRFLPLSRLSVELELPGLADLLFHSGLLESDYLTPTQYSIDQGDTLPI